jgi:hypothetical protein
MKLETISELYQLISRGTENNSIRKQAIKLRKAGLESCTSGEGFTKLAFDTRRIDQETEYNPRRGLQNYNRSEAFVTEAVGQKLINFAKLRKVLDGLRQEYGKEHEWQDSNARVLLSTLDNGLRIIQKDGDYATSQPAQGSLDYIEELLHVRYRLGFDDLTKMGEADLKRVILSKDEDLTRKDVNRALEITKSDVGSQTYDTLMEKLFGGVRATKENKSVERTVTITIKDTFVDEK